MSHLILNQSLISPQFLAANLTAENLVLLDASMKPVNPTGVKVSCEPSYIPGRWWVGSREVAMALNDPAVRVLDARSARRFTGREPEPRPGLRGGHMPGAVNLPYTEVQSGGFLHESAKLRALFANDQDKKLILSCGSGVTACILALAAELAGVEKRAVYDGSWTEWGRLDSGLPVVAGDC